MGPSYMHIPQEAVTSCTLSHSAGGWLAERYDAGIDGSGYVQGSSPVQIELRPCDHVGKETMRVKESCVCVSAKCSTDGKIEDQPTCAPGNFVDRSCSISFAIALPEVVSSVMNTLHSVVFRGRFQ